MTRPSLPLASGYHRNFRKALADPAFLETLPLMWDDEPMPWRRSWVRRFIERVDLDEAGAIAVHYRGGLVTRLDVGESHDRWAPRELAILREVYLDPAREVRGWGLRIQRALEAEGFARTTHGIYAAAKTLRDKRAGEATVGPP